MEKIFINSMKKIFINSMKYIFIILILLILYFIINISGKRYKYFLPTFNIFYPDSSEEVKKVIRSTINREISDIEFFYMTDPSVVTAFKPYVPKIPEKKLIDISLSKNYQINLLKYFINRPRPKQMSNKVRLLKSKTAHTPAFPAGHAAQAYILANYLQKIYPHKKKLFEKIADRCNDCRIKAGLHYPSDGMYSKLLFYKNN